MDSLIADKTRWLVLDPDEIPLDEYAPAPPPHVLSKPQLQAAVGKAIDQQFAAEIICALKDVFKARHIPWVPTAGVAMEMLWVSGANGEDGYIEHWMAGLTYYTQVWMIKCETQDCTLFFCSVCVCACACVRVCVCVMSFPSAFAFTILYRHHHIHPNAHAHAVTFAYTSSVGAIRQGDAAHRAAIHHRTHVHRL